MICFLCVFHSRVIDSLYMTRFPFDFKNKRLCHSKYLSLVWITYLVNIVYHIYIGLSSVLVNKNHPNILSGFCEILTTGDYFLLFMDSSKSSASSSSSLINLIIQSISCLQLISAIYTYSYWLFCFFTFFFIDIFFISIQKKKKPCYIYMVSFLVW